MDATRQKDNLVAHKSSVRMSGVKNPTNPRSADPAHGIAMKDIGEVLSSLGTTLAGLAEEEAAARIEKH
ncbi:MAG: hypothetical protein ACREIC_17555, partial [Limisphaerales bacterium]